MCYLIVSASKKVSGIWFVFNLHKCLQSLVGGLSCGSKRGSSNLPEGGSFLGVVPVAVLGIFRAMTSVHICCINVPMADCVRVKRKSSERIGGLCTDQVISLRVPKKTEKRKTRNKAAEKFWGFTWRKFGPLEVQKTRLVVFGDCGVYLKESAGFGAGAQPPQYLSLRGLYERSTKPEEIEPVIVTRLGKKNMKLG